MSPAESAHFDAILARIDAVVGKPENETEQEHQARRGMVERDARSRAIHRLVDESDGGGYS